jgi:hypothetical protein
MRIIDVGDDRYQVIREINCVDEEFIKSVTEHYSSVYQGVKLLRPVESPTVTPHYLVCLKVDDGETVE